MELGWGTLEADGAPFKVTVGDAGDAPERFR